MGDDLTVCEKKAVKVLDAETRRIGLYATIWGELDCDNDRMTKQALEPYIDGEHAPMMFWLHGMDPDFGTSKPGKWDPASFTVDETGLWVEGQVYKNATGNRAWERINDSGNCGASVGSAHHFVKRRRNADGSKDIVDWPLFEISIMRGGQQCVPSAQHDIKTDAGSVFADLAVKMGLEATDDSDQPAKHYYRLRGEVMDQDQVVDMDAVVAEQVAAQVAQAMAAEREAERKRKEEEEKRAAEIKAAAEELAQEQVEAAKAEWEANQKPTKQDQPRQPVVNAGEERAPISYMWTPYDRLDTVDLCIRYELMKSYGRVPSTKFWRALANRAVKMAREEDTLYVENGQPVKAPAIDWQSLVPRNLSVEEVDATVFATKGGDMGRYLSGGFDSGEDNVTPRGIQQLMYLTDATKANELVYSTQASAGDEWVPTLMSAQLWRTIRLNASVLPLFTQFDMPSQPYDYPIESTDPVVYKVSEATDEAHLVLTGGPFTDSKPGTGKVTFSASKLGAISYWSEEMEEDAIIAVEPQFRDQYGLKMAHSIDEVLISGDETTGTTNISYEGASITAASRFLCVDGLRHQPLVTTTADSRDGGALTIDDFNATQKLMGTAGKFGVNPSDLVFLMDTATWHTSKLIGEVLTVDKFGSAATVRTGQLGAIFGVPVVISEDYSLTDTTGMIDETAGDNTKGSFMCINRRGVMVGWRRRPRIRVVGLPGAESRYIVGSARFDIGFKEAGMVAMSYNLTV